jgi:hypothetical protein
MQKRDAAPTELVFHFRHSIYKHSAPTELIQRVRFAIRDIRTIHEKHGKEELSTKDTKEEK